MYICTKQTFAVNNKGRFPCNNVTCYQTWSLVALIYNNWIFYLPTAAEIEAEFELEPVMCTTTRNISEPEKLSTSMMELFSISSKCISLVSDNCTWWSCMEWCLSATQPPDECVHLYANVRDNGSTIR